MKIARLFVVLLFVGGCKDIRTEHYENGQKKSEGNYKDGKQHGKWTGWHENGQKKSEGEYRDDKRDGKWTEWHENGQKSSEGDVRNGKVHGKLTILHENGKKKAEGEWEEDRPLKLACWNKDGKVVQPIPAEKMGLSCPD